MRLFYTLCIYLYWFAITIAAPFNPKAKQWKQGRKKLFADLKEKCKDKQNIICFHCASLGEFEQAKPLIEHIKTEYPNATILLSFFSPSGYEHKKNDAVADIITYLPIDTPYCAKKFLQIVKPTAFFFIKYEFWYNFMHRLYLQKIPFFYVSAIFRPSQIFFRKGGKWFARQLQKASFFFVQNESSKQLLSQIGIYRVEISGDTRFDRVNAIAQQPFDFNKFMTSFKNGKKLLIAGSSWRPDEQILKDVLKHFKEQYKLIIVPHHIEKKNVQEIQSLFYPYKTILYSEIDHRTELGSYEIIIIDTIGLLSKLYRYAAIAYVGGGFETGLHNILEAAVFGIPIFFGPQYRKFNEAVELTARGGAFSIHYSKEMIYQMQEFEENEECYERSCMLCRQYIRENLGAVEKITTVLEDRFTLIKFPALKNKF